MFPVTEWKEWRDHNYCIGELRRPLELRDWIAPGEFQFCGKCGHYNSFLPGSVAKNTYCTHCKPSQSTPHIARAIELGHEMRYRIAKHRQQLGVKPLFWLTEEEWRKTVVQLAI